MTFLWPAALWILLALPISVALYVFLLARRKKQAVRFPDLALVRAAIGPSQALRRHLPPLLVLLGLLAAIVAIARPVGDITLLSSQRTIIMAIDVSLSMRASDIEPTRIDAAKRAATAFVQQQPGDVRIGIVSFGGSAALVQPPTRDKDELIAAIDRLQLQRATAIGSGLALSLQALFPGEDFGVDASLQGKGGAPKQSPATAAAKAREQSKEPRLAAPPRVPVGSDRSSAIILLTDGRRTVGPDPLAVANIAAGRGVRIFTVGFGSPKGTTVDIGGYSIFVDFDEITLKAIAELTQGEYFFAPTAAELDNVYRALDARLILEPAKTEVSAFAAAAAALLLLLAALTSLRWFGRLG